MGTYLSTPILDKSCEEGENLYSSTPMAWGVVDMQGWRKTMEDAHIAQLDVKGPTVISSTANSTVSTSTSDQAQLFAVFDGHGGAEVARFCQLYLIDVLTSQEEWNKGSDSSDIGTALVKCFHCLDLLLDDPKRRDEINYLRIDKPYASERRTLLNMAESATGAENEFGDKEDEEKKMEETAAAAAAAESSNQQQQQGNADDDSEASDEVVGDLDNAEFFSDAQEHDDGDNDSEDDSETTIDVNATDSMSIFKRLLKITNKAAGSTGTMTLNLSGAEQTSNIGNNEAAAIVPTILQNGRPVCNLPDHPIHAGCTSVCAVISGNKLTVANAGDSRVVLCRADGITEAMSYDHKPMQETEMRRITDAGGFVNQFGRVNGNLNLSRSIGDLKYKQVPNIPPSGQMITAEPDIKQVELKPDDEFIILACDGIWDCLSNEEAVKFVRDRIDTQTPIEIGTDMLDQIVSTDPRETQGIGGDNMTVMIVDLLPKTRAYRKAATGNTATSALNVTTSD